jgi:predicted transcriptional regulator
MPTPTTTIRLPEELKARLARLAEAEGTSPHNLILDAIAEKTEAMEQQLSFYAEAEARYARVLETGKAIAADDMDRYLDARVAGKRAKRPVAKPIVE